MSSRSTASSPEASLWSRFRKYLCAPEGLDLLVDPSRMDFDDAFIESMEPKMGAAFEAMRALEAGAIANPDEGRMVGHYWLRDPDLAPPPAGDEPSIAEAIRKMQDDVRSIATRVASGDLAPEKAERFRNLLVIGIGGSALGPQFVSDALGNMPDGTGAAMEVFFLDNTDPAGIDRVLERIEATSGGLASTLTLVISKSGGTAETRNGMVEAREAYSACGLRFGAHAIAITGEGSRLDGIAVRGKWIARLPMWDWVGGRTSELSAVGLLPAALQGIPVDAMLEGAREMDRATRVEDPIQNPAALLALMWYHAGGGRGDKDMVILPYSDRLLLLSRYLQQLVMESLGKEKDLEGRVVHQGLVVYGNKGSTDQHAFVQQLREGPVNFFATFIRVIEGRKRRSVEVDPEKTPGATSGDFLHGFLLGTRAALHENGRESITITVPRVDARAVGMLIALFERAVGLYASLVGINAYHQPGVEAGKKAAGGVLELQGRVWADLEAHRGTLRTAEEIASSAGTDDVETVFHILEHRAGNPALGGLRRERGQTPVSARYGLEG